MEPGIQVLGLVLQIFNLLKFQSVFWKLDQVLDQFLLTRIETGD